MKGGITNMSHGSTKIIVDTSPVAKEVKKLKKHLKSIEGNTKHINNIKGDIEKIKKRQNSFQKKIIASAYARMKSAEKFKKEIEDKHMEKSYELRKEKRSIQHDYDKTQLEFINNFADSVSTNTTYIDIIKKDFQTLSRLHESLEEDHLKILGHDISNYEKRLNDLETVIHRIKRNIETFLMKRENTAEDIDECLVDLSVNKPLLLYVPFWIVGISKNGKRYSEIYPIGKTTDIQGDPTRLEPFNKHIEFDHTDSFNDYMQVIQTPENINKIMINSILDNDELMEEISSNVEKISNYCDTSESNGGSRFINTIKQFLFRK